MIFKKKEKIFLQQKEVAETENQSKNSEKETSAIQKFAIALYKKWGKTENDEVFSENPALIGALEQNNFSNLILFPSLYIFSM
jgi:hypothetical protein